MFIIAGANGSSAYHIGIRTQILLRINFLLLIIHKKYLFLFNYFSFNYLLLIYTYIKIYMFAAFFRHIEFISKFYLCYGISSSLVKMV